MAPFVLRRAWLALALLAGLLALFSLARRVESAPVPASKVKAVFLVRFGVDGKDGVDWSGLRFSLTSGCGDAHHRTEADLWGVIRG